jgi:hypothetical protein
MGTTRGWGVSFVSFSIAVAIAGCNDPPPFATGHHDGGPNFCAGQGAGVICDGTVAHTCDGAGHDTAMTDCAASSQICAPGLGCRVCVPNHISCGGDTGETVELCDGAGATLMPGPTCDPAMGEHCSAHGCQDLCAQAVTDHSYIGCEYFPTVLPNSPLNPSFAYAIVIANPQLVSAQVTILRGADVLDRIVVDPGALVVHELPWIDALRGGLTASASALVPSGAYHVVSDVPITVTQFNPLRYQSDPNCTTRDPAAGCFSYTNDASLLLPSHVLTGSYLAMSRPSHVLTRPGDTGALVRGVGVGYVAVVNVEDHAITVSVHSTAHTLASADGTIPALAPGDEHDFMLGAGDVLLLESADPGEPCPGPTDTDETTQGTITYCDPGPGWDLTGTEIKTTARVAVFSGHDCTFVPYNRWACDHLEQQIFPVESLGHELIVPVTEPLRMGEPNLLRIVAAGTAVHVTFDPALADGTSEIDLVRGEYTEHEIRDDVHVSANGPILGALFLVGQNYLGINTVATMPLAVGDPAMSMIVPSEQYRSSYSFLAPDTYTQTFINVAIPTGSQVYLDEVPITSHLSPSVNGYSTARLRIATGAHQIRGEMPFGLYVYGFGSYTSYMYPGGMDFVHIAMPF